MDSAKQKTPELQTQELNAAYTVRPRPGKERWAYLTLEESRKRNAQANAANIPDKD